MSTKSRPKSWRVIISGVVQGVGFRPTTKKLALERGINGSVRNFSGQVEIQVELSLADLLQFISDIISRLPQSAAIEQIVYERCDSLSGLAGFQVLSSSNTSLSARGHIPLDLSPCPSCQEEFENQKNRRFGYSFINCSECGPRYTLIQQLPFDRDNTSMHIFMPCSECTDEYLCDSDRRLHSQSICCPKCGPTLRFYSNSATASHQNSARALDNGDPLAESIWALRQGHILAVKGVGGFHLFCDAFNDGAVQELRKRKTRPNKPFAVMLAATKKNDSRLLSSVADLSNAEFDLLISQERPIVIADKSPTYRLAPSVTGQISKVGIIFPSSPLHDALLSGFDGPLVCTSANQSGQPLILDEKEPSLKTLADFVLSHDRPILRSAEDSVYLRIGLNPRPLRNGRGSSPIELPLNFRLSEPLLALGSENKNCMAIGLESYAFITPHIGTISTIEMLYRFEETFHDIQTLIGVKPKTMVCDPQPNSLLRQWAKDQNMELVSAYHHHCHASALFTEHAETQPIIAFTWDGIGYGTNQEFWGGEAFYGTAGQWQQVGSIKPFKLLGGDIASRAPWRSALSLCWEAGLDWESNRSSTVLRDVWSKSIQSPYTSSIGRLFDAAAAIIGLCEASTFEAQAAMLLEQKASFTHNFIPLPMNENDRGIRTIDWQPLLKVLLDSKRSQEERASLFHSSLAHAILEQALRISERFQTNTVGLTGGVFQNRLLTEQAKYLLEKSGFRVLLHERIPPNDANIAYGQIAEYALNRNHQRLI